MTKRTKQRFTRAEFRAKIKALGETDKETRNKIVCSLLGHSKIITTCFGYIYCARCEAQIGDALGGYFDASKYVIVGHNCEKCRENFDALTWRDKAYCPDPFKEEHDG